jgi:hypothetical protein
MLGVFYDAAGKRIQCGSKRNKIINIKASNGVRKKKISILKMDKQDFGNGNHCFWTSVLFWLWKSVAFYES